MKLTKITSMMAAAVAVGFCMSAAAGEGQSGKLELDNPTTNVNVTATALTGGGTWNTTPAVDPSPAVESSYIVIDCDAASSNQFTATTATSGKIVKCTFKLQAAPVPLPLSNPDSNTQVAFCIATNTTSGGAATFQAYVNNSWTTLTGANIPATDSEYTLTITFDYSGTTKYAKFTIGSTDLAASGNSWLQTSKSSDSVQEYCFIGDGRLKSILTTGQDVTAEDISITPAGGGTAKEIAVPEELVAALREASVADMGTKLSEDAGNGASLLENYVLFGVTSSDDVSSTTKPEAKIATAKVDGDIPLNFQNLDNRKTVDGVTPKYQLQGRTGSTGSWTNVGVAQTDPTAVKIPASAINTNNYRDFRVVVTFEY